MRPSLENLMSYVRPSQMNACPSQAIETKRLLATNSRQTRIKATCARGSITVPYDHALPMDSAQNHQAAAKALCLRFIAEDAKHYGTPKEKNPWGRPFLTGCLPSGNFAHVFINSPTSTPAAK